MGNWDSYRDDLDALKIELEKLFEVRNDVMRRVRIAEEEEQQMMKPTTDEEVQLWLSKVQAEETEVDDLIRRISQEIEELHPGGFCSRNLLNMPSSYEFEDIVADKLQAVMNLIREGDFVVSDDEAQVVTIPKDEGVAENLPEDVLYDEGTIVGMQSIFTKVWRCLEEGGEGGGYVGIIGLYGMGGVGKTTLLKQIYRNMLDNYGQNNFAVVIWVSVSKELRFEKIQEKIGMKIGLFDKVWKNKKLEEKASDILKILEEKKFVLFMDELWERVDLTKVGVPFPNPENSSKIVFTTRSLEICRLMEADRQFKMNCLSGEEAWELFEMSVGDETLHSHPEQVVDIARDISKECSGLPLALVSIGRALAGIKTPQQWRDVLGVLTRRSWSTSSISGSDDQLKKRIYYNLKLSYDHLQNDMFKSCLLYCCLFPRNDKISKGHLIDCWIGEEFLDDRLGAQSQGYHIIDVLLSACLLEEEEEDDNYVKMHNWIHDMTLWITTEIEEEKRNFFVCADADLTEPPEIEKWVNMTRISMTKNGFTNLENAPMCSHLQTLFLNKNKIKMIGGDFFRFMRCLKVLNLSDNELLELPSEISNLVSLQHLDLSRTAIKSLPHQLGALKKLKCLNLEDTSQLYAIPPRLISTLSVLHVLRLQGCGFLDQSGEDSVVCKDAQLLIEELFCLKNLSMLSIGLRNSHALQKLLSSYRLQSCIQSLWLHSLQHPKSIVISISYMNHLKTLRISECEYLEELEVDFVGEAQAQAISNFYFLDEVIIESCPNLQDLTWLILAPNLKHLEISQCSELEEIIKVWKLSACPELMRNLTPFLKLHFLKLSNLPNLRSIYWCDLLFPDLKDRIITECPKLRISLPPHRFNKDHSKEKITVNVPSGPSGMLVQKIVSSYEKALPMLMNSNSSTSTSTSTRTTVVLGSADHQQPAVGVAAAAQPTYGAGLGVETPPLGREDSYRDQKLKDDSKKRKATSRWTDQVRVNLETGMEGPLDDGFSWRKYGQRDILGAKYPRGYYRCTHRNTQGCLATKQVQRSDEDPKIFEITYHGSHTCTLASKTTNNPPENQEPTYLTTWLSEYYQQALLQHGSGSSYQQQQQQHPEALSNLMFSNSSTSTSTSVVTDGADHQQPAVGVAAAAQPTYGAGLGVESPPLSGEDSDRDQELKDGSKKRKATKRWTHQVRINPATGLEGTLDDGFSWRKYGQKDILGAKHPRGYYRCTHRHAQGCLATKQVQRSDEDPMIFEITYRGRHTCTQASKTTNNPPENQEPTNMTTSLLEYSQQALLQHGSGSSYQQQQQQHPEALLNLRLSLQVVTDQEPDHHHQNQVFSPAAFTGSSSVPFLFSKETKDGEDEELVKIVERRENLISSTPQIKYDVFLSFRGYDIRNTFTSHLCQALRDKQIETYMDDKLNRGDEISPSLLSTIEESHISIVIFSKNYGSSRWCLEELVKIVECRENHKQIVIPVFYEIDPMDVRNQTGSYAEAFAQHEQRLDKVQRVQRWKDALKQAANLSGFDSRVIKPESVLINIIVDDVLKRLDNMSPSYNTNLPGMNSRIQQIESLLRRGDVRSLGIWGIGGIGKTTLAQEVSKKISCQFESSGFAGSVREYSKQGRLDSLQRSLFSTLLKHENAYICAFTKKRLSRKKLLIILDDVTDFTQIEKLIGDLDCLAPESRIIITSRDKQVLQNCRVHHIYQVEELCFNDALKLFCQHAFRQNRPKVDYKELSNNVVEKVGGVPLALEVLGSTLFGKTKKVWESALEKLENNFDKKILEVLKISYEELDGSEQSLFLDIACLFKGWNIDTIKMIMDDCGSLDVEISDLIDKSLISESGNMLTMHDLLQDMGKEIVHQECINDFSKHTQLLHHKDIYDVLTKDKDPNHGYVDKEHCKVEMRGVHLMTGLHLKTSNENEEKDGPHLEESDEEDEPPPKRLKHIEEHTPTEKLN